MGVNLNSIPMGRNAFEERAKGNTVADARINC
jgi:hypothetical protein